VLQLPIAASSRPRLTRAASKDCGCGGSIAANAGRHAMTKAVAAPPATSAARMAPITLDLVIRPSGFFEGS